MESTNKKSESNFLVFYRKWKQGINNIVIFSILSLVSIYFSIDNLYILIISIPLTTMSIVGIYIMTGNFHKHLKSQEKKQEVELEEIQKNIFNSLSNEEQKDYLKKNPDSMIYDYVKSHLKKNVEIILLKNLIRIETELNNKFDDNFYSDINLKNFNEKLNLILDSLNEKNDVEIYRKEQHLKDKIKFFTFFQIFNDDLYNIDLQPVKNGRIYTEHKISFDNKSSINENFILKLNEVLKNTETPFVRKSDLRLNRSGGSIHLKTLIENHLINNYEKIVGNILKIENLNGLYKKYKDLKSRFIPFNELGIGDRLGKWNYVFYEEKNIPEISMIPNDNKNSTIEGEKVLNEINLILEN